MTDRTMTPTHNTASHTRANIMWIITALIGIVFGVLYFLLPDTNDEYWFKTPMLPYIKEPSLSAFFESVWDCCHIHYLYDNGRLANVVGAVMLLLPRWLSAVLLGGSVAYSMVLSARIAGIWRKSVPAYIALVFLWVFALPWNDKMLTLIFSYNYVCGAALSLLLIAITLRAKKMSIIASFALALITGLWHEGFSGPLLCAIAALAVTHRRYRTKRIGAMLLGLALGIAYLWQAPGTDCRFSGIPFCSGVRNLVSGWYYGIVCYASIVIVLIRVFARRSRSLLVSSPTFITMLIAMIAAWGVWRVFMGGARITFTCSAFSLVLFLALTAGRLRVRRQPRHHTAFRRYAIAAGAASCCALIAVNLTASIISAAKARECSRMMIEQYRLTPDDDIYIPIKMPWQMSIWTFGKIDALWFISATTTGYYKQYFYGSEAQVSELRPVPCGLQGFAPAKAEEIGKGAYKAYLYGHVVVFEAPEHAYTLNDILINFGGKKACYQLYLMPFRGADGKEYTYVSPYGCYKEAMLYGEPTDVELIPLQCR